MKAIPVIVLAIALVSSACGGEEAEVLQQGKALYNANCLSCHGGAKGGSLRDIPPPHNRNGHTWGHPDQQLIDMTLNGFAFSVEEQKMPAFRDTLSREDVEAILAYMKSWWTAEQRSFQATVTARWAE